MKRVLVFGADGFLGRRVVEYFKDGYEVISGNHKDMDITDTECVNRIFRLYKPDYMINCAAISSVSDCEKDKDGSRRINVDGCVNIAKAALLTNTKCIFCSSDQVYFGSNLEGAHTEEEELFPFNEYGRQKLEAEQFVLKFNPNAVFLRLSWMYDVEKKSETEHGDFMQNLIRQIKNEENIKLAVHDIRGITDVNEVIRNLEKAFILDGGVYNFASPNDKNIYQTIYEVYECLGWKTDKLEINETAFGDNPRNMWMAQSKLNNAGIYFRTTREALFENLRKIFGENDALCSEM